MTRAMFRVPSFPTTIIGPIAFVSTGILAIQYANQGETRIQKVATKIKPTHSKESNAQLLHDEALISCYMVE
jgi:hypothetical protein